MCTKFISCISCMFFLCTSIAQNVGVGTSTPAEKLDVNGNINLSGSLKVNGDAGTANQVLMKGAANTLTWGDLSDYKNLVVFDCAATASTAGANNCTSTWDVPAGVTKIYVECWGGGGGGNSLSGGGGGGYLAAKLDVTPATTTSIVVAAGGQYGTASTTAITGGTTTFSVGPYLMRAVGGQGGNFGDALSNFTSYHPAGGGFFMVGSTTQYLGFWGDFGGITRVTFMQAGTSDFAKIINYGDGGDAAMLPGSGAKGGYRVVSAALYQTFYANVQPTGPGGGGGADNSNGYPGRGGRIVIHW